MQFMIKEILKANKHKNRHSNQQVIRERKVKITMKCNFTARLLKFRKLDYAKCWLGSKTVRTERHKKR